MHIKVHKPFRKQLSSFTIIIKTVQRHCEHLALLILEQLHVHVDKHLVDHVRNVLFVGQQESQDLGHGLLMILAGGGGDWRACGGGDGRA